MSANAIFIEAYAKVQFAGNNGVVTEEKILDISRLALNFPLNDRPRCSMAVALGRRSDDVTQASPIHSILERLALKQKVFVYISLRTMGLAPGQRDVWPADPFLVFEGSTTGFGYRRTSGGAEYLLNLEHWLGDLAFSSSVSAISVPDNPAQLTFNSVTAPAQETGAVLARTGGLTGLTFAEEFVTRANIEQDFWGKALQPFLLALTEMETFVTTPFGIQQNIENGPLGNRAARQALLRIEPMPPPPPSGTYVDGVALRMDPAAYAGDLSLVAGQISQSLGNEVLQVLTCSTIWDKLIQIKSSYMMALSPLVTKALMVPFVPGLRTPYKTILASEYDFVNLQGDMPRTLRGVGLYGGLRFVGGSDLQGDVPMDYDNFGIGGYFQGAPSGQIVFKQAPDWALPSPDSLFSDSTSGGNGLIHSNALSAGAGAIPTAALASPNAQAVSTVTLLNRLARCFYIYEVLKFRSGDLSGKLRFDIAPGSVISVEGCGDKFLGISDQLGDHLWATVIQTDINLDVENSKAGTSFRLAHIRNRQENANDGYSIASHPLWSRSWNGCPLIAL